LLLVTRGLVEVWHTNQDLLVKQLMIGALFGEMPLLGQTMVITQAISGPAGATVAVMNTERVRELIEANALALAETLYPRLASVDAEHYRAVFQAVESRVAALLLELAGDGASVEGLTQRQLGERMALVRETITAAVSSLKARKLIGVDHRRTTIFNRKALEQLSRS
jgi:CRP-like cAMP-binding protein